MNPLAARAAGLICTGCVSFIGLDFKLAPVLIGMSTAALIRVPMFKPKARLWAELSFSAVAVIGSFSIIAENDYGPGKAFATGIVMGAAASSLLEVGKSAFFSMIGDRMQAAGRVFFGVKGPDA